jgi:transposase-like protein
MKKNEVNQAGAQAAAAKRDPEPNPFLEIMRTAMRETAERMLAEEVAKLCGPRHYPLEGAVFRRAGSEAGKCYAEGDAQELKRPRVRIRGEDGREREHVLASYQAMRDPANNAGRVVRELGAGMSTRGLEWANEGATSKSAASVHWIKASAAKIEELRQRELKTGGFVGLMLDGVCVGAEAMVVGALGITRIGEKVVLDFEVGASENGAVANALVARLVARGFGPLAGHRLLAVLDGSAPLSSAILSTWPDALIQRCVIHKERNLFGYLRKSDHAECRRLWRRLRSAQGADAGRESLSELRAFVAARNAAALASLDEAGESLITLHLLDVPATLNRSLLSTNAIENVMRNYRAQTAKVTRWRAETDQISRWSATALLHVETGFHRIKGHGDMPVLLQALALPSLTPGGGGASPLHTSPSKIALVQSPKS